MELILQVGATIFFGSAALVSLVYLIFGWNPGRLIRAPEPMLRAWATLSISIATLGIIDIGFHGLWSFALILPYFPALRLFQIIKDQKDDGRVAPPS